MEAQKIQPVFQGENCCLRIEFEVEVAHPTLNVLQKKLKFPLCPGDDVEIVHVSSVIAASPVFLDVMVELIKEHQGEQLAGLIPKGQAVGLVNVDAHEVIERHIYAALLHQGPQFCFQDVMVDGGEEMVNIALQHPSVCAAVLAVVIDHVSLQAHDGIQCPLSALRSVVVADEAGADRVVQNIVR